MKLFTIPAGPLGTNCYLGVTGSGSGFVVDPGAEGDKILRKIEQEAAKLKYILLTHGHFDHIGAAWQLKQAFPEVKVLISAKDAKMLEPGGSAYALAPLPAEAYFPPDQKLFHDDIITLDELTFQVLATPGHTPGSLCFLCENLLFSGDTLFSGSIGRCDFPGGSDGQMMQSLRKLAALPGDFRVLPGHGEETALSIERASNPFLRKAVAGC